MTGSQNPDSTTIIVNKNHYKIDYIENWNDSKYYTNQSYETYLQNDIIHVTLKSLSQ